MDRRVDVVNPLNRVKPWMRSALLAGGLIMAACTREPSSLPTATPVVPTETPVPFTPTPELIIPTPEISPTAVPAKPEATATPAASLLPLCHTIDTSRPRLPAIFPREDYAETPKTASEILNAFQANPKKVFSYNVRDVTDIAARQALERERTTQLLDAQRMVTDPNGLDVLFAGFGHAYTRSQITNTRPDAMMTMLIDPGAFSENKTHSDIYAPFRHCSNGIGMAMTLEDPNALLLYLAFDQPHSTINPHPIQRKYFLRLEGYDDSRPGGNLITTGSINGIFLGPLQINGRRFSLEAGT